MSVMKMSISLKPETFTKLEFILDSLDLPVGINISRSELISHCIDLVYDAALIRKNKSNLKDD